MVEGDGTCVCREGVAVFSECVRRVAISIDEQCVAICACISGGVNGRERMCGRLGVRER